MTFFAVVDVYNWERSQTNSHKMDETSRRLFITTDHQGERQRDTERQRERERERGRQRESERVWEMRKMVSK